MRTRSSIAVTVGNLTIWGGNHVVQSDTHGNQFYEPNVALVLLDLVQVTGTLDVDGEHSAKIDLPSLARVGEDVTSSSGASPPSTMAEAPSSA